MHVIFINVIKFFTKKKLPNWKQKQKSIQCVWKGGELRFGPICFGLYYKDVKYPEMYCNIVKIKSHQNTRKSSSFILETYPWKSSQYNATAMEIFFLYVYSSQLSNPWFPGMRIAFRNSHKRYPYTIWYAYTKRAGSLYW